MASKVAIANLALTKLGTDRIVSITEDSKSAREINAVYDVLRQAELRAHQWSFSIKRASLAAMVAVPEFEYDLQYQLPTGCLRLLEVNGATYLSLSEFRQGEPAPYVVEGGKILTSMSAPLLVRYIFDEEDTGVFDASFTTMLACRIAMETCQAIVGSTQQKQLLASEYELAKRDAITANAIEVPPRALDDDTWIAARV